MARAEFSRRTKLEAFNRASGHCETCGCKILSGAEYDHRIPDMVDGGNDVENCRVLCARCHRLKTKADRPEIDKTRRILKKRAGLRKPKGRPLPGTKASGWRKRMNGTVERRSCETICGQSKTGLVR